MQLSHFASIFLTLFYLVYSSNLNNNGGNFGLPGSREYEKKRFQLIASGMRRKNLFVTEVDVYKVGIYTTDAMEKKIKEHKDLSEALDKSQDGLAIVLQFVRAVPSKKVVDAIVDALNGPGDEYKQALNTFSNMLVNAIGKSGVSPSDEIEFVFGPKESFEVIAKSKHAGRLSNKTLRKRLADRYVGEDGVVPSVRLALLNRFRK